MDLQQTGHISRLPLLPDRPVAGSLAATAITVFAFWVRVALDSNLPPGLPYVTFFPAVVLSAYVFGLVPGCVSAVLGLLISWYQFIPPAAFGIDGGTIVALSLYMFVVVVDIALITVMQRTQQRLVEEREVSRQLAATRGTLFQELQHRVGNNLQMVGSMLSLQRRGLTGDAAHAVGEAAQRIALIGAMQRDLYRNDGEPTGLLDLVDKVCRETLAMTGRDDITLEIGGDSRILLVPGRAIPASLVVAESVANAIEHGLAGGGTVSVSVSAPEQIVKIVIANGGGKLPVDFDPDRVGSLGLQLASLMSRQLGGAYSLRQVDETTVAEVTFPLVV